MIGSHLESLSARAIACGSAIAAIAATLACGPTDARFATKVASDFAPVGHRVSVVGVYKDGQMSSDAWATVSARFSQALGASACEAAYGDALHTTNGALASAIDEYARDDGPTDDLVGQLAPAAKGDLLVVFTVSGQLPTPAPKKTAAPAPSPRQAGGGRMRRGPQGAGFASNPDTNELDFSASIFSVPLHRSVGLVTMQYFGASVDDAVAKFADRLAMELPSAHCEGWDWTASIDPERIRQSIDQ